MFGNTCTPNNVAKSQLHPNPSSYAISMSGEKPLKELTGQVQSMLSSADELTWRQVDNTMEAGCGHYRIIALSTCAQRDKTQVDNTQVDNATKQVNNKKSLQEIPYRLVLSSCRVVSYRLVFCRVVDLCFVALLTCVLLFCAQVDNAITQ